MLVHPSLVIHQGTQSMQLPVQITFRGMESSAALDDAVRDRAAKLEQFHPRITSCRVVIEQPAHHKR
ncbi:MAG: HPF/RaiA family ribosome-associated protein, partial [Betaproteobacteria bacterium]|nr:HPF/RaiA family ribosome-associated protein [Betaproteobacteria bacterium]